MKHLKILILLLLVASLTQAQSPFRRMPKPAMKMSAVPGIVTTNPTVTAFRFSPMAGYNLSTKQLMAGIGYGIQWMHFIDSTQKFYTKYSLQIVGWVNGNTTPSLSPPNFVSFGLSAGFLNQLVQIGFAYSPPNAISPKGSIGPVVNFSIPLNN